MRSGAARARRLATVKGSPSGASTLTAGAYDSMSPCARLARRAAARTRCSCRPRREVSGGPKAPGAAPGGRRGAATRRSRSRRRPSRKTDARPAAREVVVRGAPFSEEQAAVLVVARILDAAVERFGRIVGKLEGEAPTHEAFVADAAGELPGKEALEGGCLALGVVRYGHCTGGRGARRAFSDLDAKPLREAHVRGLGEQGRAISRRCLLCKPYSARRLSRRRFWARPHGARRRRAPDGGGRPCGTRQRGGRPG